jgi:hypothetical protein
LDGEGLYYFGQFRRLARRILRSVDVEQAYQQAQQEMDAEFNCGVRRFSIRLFF